jgi:tetratricopeptide (TPR) repeat protein
MSIYSCLNKQKTISAIILFIFGCVTFLFAQEPRLLHEAGGSYVAPASGENEESLSELQKQARMYRNQGVEFQRMGNLEAAMSLYQKAVALDPAYAVAYNDLGIIYEANGLIDQAQDCYLRCIQIDPTFLSAYTNLGLLFEMKRDLDSAAYYWEKRVKLGSSNDPWTKKAEQHLEDVRMALSSRPLEYIKEREAMKMLKEFQAKNAILKRDNKEQARDFFEKAKICYKNGDEVTALKLAIDARQLDPANTEIEEFTDKVQARLLSK